MAVAAGLYALVFGLLETLAVPVQQLGLAWQVPAQWLRGRSALAQTLIWGTTLGPGLMTRNPYAGMWLLPILLTISQHFWVNVGIGILIGLAHGSARALGIARLHNNLGACEVGITLLMQWRWRVADGCLLLLAAGSFTAAALAFIAHL